MKKMIFVLIMLLAATTLFAQAFNLGNFPVGQWQDPNYDAVWDFSSNNIRILDTNGAVLYDFSTKTIQNFRVFLDGTNPGISFTCPESERSYRFVKPLTNNDVNMEIERTGRPKYNVTLKRK